MNVFDISFYDLFPKKDNLDEVYSDNKSKTIGFDLILA